MGSFQLSVTQCRLAYDIVVRSNNGVDVGQYGLRAQIKQCPQGHDARLSYAMNTTEYKKK